MRLFAFAILILTMSIPTTAQNEIMLDLNYLWGGEPFVLGNTFIQTNGNDIQIDRCEFYISQISITHDNGEITEINDTWILSNPNEASFSLGTHDINTVSAITFSVGVEQPVNNNAPTLWPEEHPLSLHIPSMHWGWTSGYRFVALEGSAGEIPLTEAWEIHALGNNQYFEQTIQTGGILANDELRIGLDVNVDRFFEGWIPDFGIIAHGESGQIISQVMQNAKNLVFTATDGTVHVNNQKIEQVRMYPNPTSGPLYFSNKVFGQVEIVYPNGKTIQREIQGNKINLGDLPSGLYLVGLKLDNGQKQVTRVALHYNR